MAGVVRVKIEDEEYDSVTKGTDLLTSPPASSRPSRKRRAPELYEPSTAVKIEWKSEERIPPNAALLSKASSTKTGKKGSQSSKKSRKKIAGDEPYPDYALPLSHHCLVARDSLAHLHNYLPGANPAEDTGKSLLQICAISLRAAVKQAVALGLCGGMCPTHTWRRRLCA